MSRALTVWAIWVIVVAVLLGVPVPFPPPPRRFWRAGWRRI